MITKEPTNKISFSLNRFFTKSARSAFLHILRKERDAGRTLLLPAYIGMNAYEGSGVFDVVLISRIPYEFYAVDNRLAPVMNSLPNDKNTPFLFLLIHYFGIPPHNFEEVLEYCKNGNRTLVEDCAHTLNGSFQQKALGSYGAYAFHSIHKVIPSTDGGILVDNTGQKNFTIDPVEEGIKTETVVLFSTSDHAAIAAKRIANYNYWNDQLGFHDDLQPMHSNLQEGTVPLNFPVLVKNNKREALYFHLMERNAPTCALYYKMIPQINSSLYPLSYQISEEILNLPTHQDTTFEDIEHLILAINSFFEK